MNKIFTDIYDYRQMISSLVRKDLRGRYKGSVLGFLWTFLNPLLQLIVYTFLFSVVLRQGIDKYYLFLFVALVPWIFFSTCVAGGANCIIGYGDLVKKIYFPREVLPISFVVSQFVNMIYSFVVVLLVLFVTGYGFNFLALTFLPLIMAVEFLLALGMTFLFSAITVYLRDVGFFLGIITMAWQFLSPVMYPMSWVPAKYMVILKFNPMVPVINAYRDVLYYKTIPTVTTLGWAVLTGIFFLIVGEFVFAKLQKGFAENL